MKAANVDVMLAGAGGPRRKCRRSSQSSDDKKPRGRPRVEPQDETAADRRRTQIRLAQRAYRLRKETTITSLKKRNQELTEVINDMFAAVTAFRDSAVASGLETLSTSIFADLNDTERVFGQLRERAAAGCDDEPDSPEKMSKGDAFEPLLDSPMETQSQVQAQRQERKLSSSSTTYDTSPTIVSRGVRGVPSVWGYEVIHNEKTAIPLQCPAVPRPPAVTAAAQGGAAGNGAFWDDLSDSMHLDTNLDAFQAATTAPTLTAPHQPPLSLGHFVAQPALGGQLCAPASFAWQEASFSRQLHRATLEAAVMLIQRQILSPGRFNRKFQLCLPFGGRDSLLGKITDTLSRESGQVLDWSDHPIRHLGGAGTHFNRRKDSGSNSPMSDDTQTTASLGANMLAELMNPASEGSKDGRAVDIHGFEGEWFDADDVQGYLEHKGVRIEPGNNTAVLEHRIDMVNGRRCSPTSSLDGLDLFSLETGTFGGGRTRHSFSDSLPLPGHAGQHMVWNSPPASRVHSGSPASVGAGVSPPSQSNRTTQRQKAVVNVPVLVQEIIKHATCLGRTPGYRRRDVDRAIQMSLSVAA